MVLLVQDYVSHSARRFPDKTAVACRESAITFQDLEVETNALARMLVSRGVRRGSFVPIFMAKGVNAIKAILAILKADCAYVPLDVNSPPDRLTSILAAAQADLVLVDDDSLPLAQQKLGALREGSLVNVDVPVGYSGEPLQYENLSIDIAYVLFTSGSTGTPKGVMISHQMIVDYIEWCVETYALDERDVIANHAPLYFDNSTFDLYTAFKVGAELHLVHDDLNVIMHKLINWLEDRRITTFFCVPSVLAILLRSGRITPGLFPDLRHVIAAGEVLPPEVVRGWMLTLPHIQYTNMYGPTEITVDCTFHLINDLPGDDVRTIPIGLPRRNMEVFVRLADGSLSKAPGSEGEIAVRGKSVSYGYLNDPEKTQRAFIQNPRNQFFHDPIYLTGDLARIDDAGRFLYLGRKDQQIKYMGNRIELGEIEAMLQRVPGVLEGVVVFNDDPSPEKKCIGALVCLAEGLDTKSIANELKAMLPQYMLPKRIRATREMPRTPNGKSDRRAAFDLLFPAERTS